MMGCDPGRGVACRAFSFVEKGDFFFFTPCSKMRGGAINFDGLVITSSPLKNVASAAEARKNEAKKRSLHVVNEHFGVSQARLPEPNFDDASADSERRETSSAVVFQRAARVRPSAQCLSG
jgi:hypothetical protein